MGKFGDITVDVKVGLTITDDTAYTILGLLEMYCRENKKTIDIGYFKPANSDEEFEVAFDFKDDRREEHETN